jgi:hypothetical protein
LYAEAARPGGKLAEAVDESATGSVYSFPSIPHSVVSRIGFVVVAFGAIVIPALDKQPATP